MINEYIVMAFNGFFSGFFTALGAGIAFGLFVNKSIKNIKSLKEQVKRFIARNKK